MGKLEFENIKDHLQSLADLAVKYAKKYPEVEIEAFVSYGYESSVAMEQGLPKASDGFDGGIGVRAAEKKGNQFILGFSSSSGMTEDIIKSTVDEAIATMRTISDKDERFIGFADPIKKHSVDGDLYKPILDITSADLIKNVIKLVNEATGIDSRISSITSEAGVTYGGFAVANSRDINVSSLSMASYVFVHCIAQEGEKRKFGFKFDVTRSRDLQMEDFSVKAAKHALEMLDTKKLDKTAPLPTVWEPNVSSIFFTSSLSYAFNGRPVVEGRTRFADRIGETIAHPSFSLIDDGQIPEGLNTSAFDGEGIPQQTTTLIDKGVLKQFIFDSYYANIFGTSSTGNASRGGHETTPNVDITTFVVPAGSKDQQQAISEIKEGIFIVDNIMGLGHSDPISGDFSALASQSYYIKNGEIQGALDPVTVAGNFYTALKDIITICSDSVLTPWKIKVPSIVFDGFTVSG